MFLTAMAQFIEMEMEAQEGPKRSQDQVGFLVDCLLFPDLGEKRSDLPRALTSG